MNKDIKTMIDLQGFWNNILACRNIIKKSEESISYWDKELNIKKQDLARLGEEIKNLKILVNQNEIELSEVEDHLKKLEIKKDNVKTEKENKAIEHEFEKARADKDAIEDNLITMFDSIEEKEKNYVSLESEIKDQEKQSVADIRELKEKIIQSQNSAEENQRNFDQMIEELSPNIKPKFLKLIKSQNGIGIAKIEGEICGACNFKIPFNLTQDISKEDHIVICTNCGRFLYKETA